MKNAFGYQNDAMKISYLCNFVDLYILNAVGYRRFKEEKGLLEAILGYVKDHLHPMLIKQLNMWRTTIEKKMPKEIMKDIKTIKNRNQIIETFQALEMSRDNMRKILSQEEKLFG